jgi:tryptophanyl-tRNA synthetase
MIATKQNGTLMSRKQLMDIHQDLDGCIDEREALERAEATLEYALNKSLCYEAPKDFIDAMNAALVAIQERLSDIRSVENELYRKLEMAGQPL